jgi:lipopolysaccharide biosynthesis regulator YciM
LHFSINGEYKLAIQAFDPLFKGQSPSSPEAQRLAILLGMAHNFLLSRQIPCALDTFHQMVTLNAESAETDMPVGEALNEMKDTIGAIREFRAAPKANPKAGDRRHCGS